jgi:hypothetical protein
MEAYRQSLERLRILDVESEDVVLVVSSLASVERLSGDHDAAERDYREALRIATKIGDHAGVATAIGNLSELALDCADWQGAEQLARETLPLAEKMGQQELIAGHCQVLAKALVRQGRLRRLPKVTQRRSAGVPQIENGIGNGNEIGGSSSTPKACVACD